MHCNHVRTVLVGTGAVLRAAIRQIDEEVGIEAWHRPMVSKMLQQPQGCVNASALA
jgi:hypothetical protein